MNVAGSDDRLSKEEDKLLNNTSRALELDLNRFQQMKTSTIANIETIEESDEDSEETIFNFSKDMTDAEKKAKQDVVKDLWEVEGYGSWTFDETICDYKPPKEYPSDNKVHGWKESTQEWVQYPEDGKYYEWDKTNGVWKEITE